MWRLLRDFECSGKTVIVRVDFNIPLEGTGAVHNDFRIVAAAPTIKYLLSRGARVIIMTHLGEPNKIDPALSTKRLIPYIEKAIGVDVFHNASFDVNDVRKHSALLDSKKILLLENIRFHPGEISNDDEFARILASFADAYVNDAFGVVHRVHASVCAITKFLPSYAGLLMEHEVAVLGDIFMQRARPLTFVVGGGKVFTKAMFLKHIAREADYIIVGGVLGNMLLKLKGMNIGKSSIDGKSVALVDKIHFGDNLFVPCDVVVSKKQDIPDHVRVVAASDVADDEYILDVGEKTLSNMQEIIMRSKTVVWNGPFGLYEIAEFAKGTYIFADMLTHTKARVIIGGGDLTAALAPWIETKSFYHVSTGGGAMLEFLSQTPLPGLKALGYYI